MHYAIPRPRLQYRVDVEAPSLHILTLDAHENDVDNGNDIKIYTPPLSRIGFFFFFFPKEYNFISTDVRYLFILFLNLRRIIYYIFIVVRIL